MAESVCLPGYGSRHCAFSRPLRPGRQSWAELQIHHSTGFTLLEVLVAFIVLAVSLGAAFEVFSTGMRGERAAQSLTTATLLAQSRLAAVTAENTLQEGETEGEDQAGYRWRVSVRPYILLGDEDDEDDDIPNLPNAFVVTVGVAEIDGGPTATLTTLRLAPKSGDR